MLIDDASGGSYDFCWEGVQDQFRMSVAILRWILTCIVVAVMPLSLAGQSPSASPPSQTVPEQTSLTQTSQTPQTQAAQNQATQAPGPPLQGTAAAVLHTQGGVWINGSEARDSTAVFPGDLIETKPGFAATLNLEGSEVLLAPEAVAKFNGDSLALDHGSISVGSSRNFKVQVNCITVVPAASVWTQFEVSDLNGTVQVAARKADVNVQGGRTTPGQTGSSGGTVHEGEQKSFDEAEMCGKPAQPASPARGISPIWIAGGAAGIGVLIWILAHGTGSPTSPSSP